VKLFVNSSFVCLLRVTTPLHINDDVINVPFSCNSNFILSIVVIEGSKGKDWLISQFEGDLNSNGFDF
jgi:hypothetical protein